MNRAHYQTSPIERNEVCRSCFAKYICSGGCYHDNLGTSGSLDQPNPATCAVTRRTAELSAAICASLTDADKRYLVEAGLTSGDPKPEKI